MIPYQVTNIVWMEGPHILSRSATAKKNLPTKLKVYISGKTKLPQNEITKVLIDNYNRALHTYTFAKISAIQEADTVRITKPNPKKKLAKKPSKKACTVKGIIGHKKLKCCREHGHSGAHEYKYKWPLSHAMA